MKLLSLFITIIFTTTTIASQDLTAERDPAEVIREALAGAQDSINRFEGLLKILKEDHNLDLPDIPALPTIPARPVLVATKIHHGDL